ncbi:MAG: hypothetical protein WC827_01965 [Candidatus Paceibacterota bacterium]|jgi:hypothetical protein
MLFFLSIVFLLSVLYLGLRLSFSALAEKNILVTSIKNGRIKFVIKTIGGPVVQYLANLKGLGKHINEETGLIENGEEKFHQGNRGSIFWQLFGVRWIGLCSIYKYEFPKRLIDGTSPEGETVTAESMFFRSAYPVEYRDVESRGTIKFNFKTRIGIEIMDPAKTISLGPNWPSYFINPAKDSLRGVVGGIKPMSVMTQKSTGAIKAKIEKAVLLHSDPKSVAGIEIRTVDIMDIEPEEDFQKVLKAKSDKELLGDADITAAEKEQRVAAIKAKTAEITAEGIAKAKERTGQAEAKVLKQKLDSLGGKGETFVGVLTAQSISENKELKYLSLGGNAANVVIPGP